MPKISVVVPVYKAEKYIKRSIESLLSQTFCDWECILVVDGSPDNSGKICQYYSQRDSRFKTIIKENGGVSSARNVGLQVAIGEYITFLDSDDRLAINALYEYNKCMDEMTDIVAIGTAFEDDNGILRPWRTFRDRKLTKEDDCGLLLRYGSVCGKMYKRKTIIDNKIRFNETICNGEDCLFFWNYIEKASTIYTSSFCGYYYYKPGNVMTLTNSVGDPYKWLQSYRLLNKEFNDIILGEFKINSEDLQALRSFIASLARHALFSAYSKGIIRSDRKEMFLEYKKEFKYYHVHSLKCQIEDHLMSFPFVLFDALYMIKNKIW